jgi:hypothetical protein
MFEQQPQFLQLFEKFCRRRRRQIRHGNSDCRKRGERFNAAPNRLQVVAKLTRNATFARNVGVEPTGFEPVTSSMPLRRSTN